MAPSNPADRLKSFAAQLTDSITLNKKKPLPSFDELPKYKNFTGCAWGIWGEKDELGTVNLLTDEVVKRTAGEEIRSGRRVGLNWFVFLLV